MEIEQVNFYWYLFGGTCTRTGVGIGGIISNNISLCADVVIGAGAVEVRNIDMVGTYAGVPAKLLKSNRPDA